MKKIFTLVAATLVLGTISVFGQSMKITKTDGSVYSFNTEDIKTVEFVEAAQADKENGYDFVDLGLPSGTMWAKCNVGATVPEAAGDYFAWGEVETKSDYTSITYKYAAGSLEGEQDYDALAGVSKYNTSFTMGKVDNRKVLEPEDDAAHVNMGGAWRMPTIEEWTELLTYCTMKATKINEVMGYTFTAQNGNSIFIPSVGLRYGEIQMFNGPIESMIFGFYWSSSLCTEDCSMAQYVHTGNAQSTTPLGFSYRFYGQSVRAVFKK